MRKLSILVVAFASLVLCSTSNADITNVTAWSGNSGSITCGWSYDGTTNLTITGNQLAESGKIFGHVWTDTPEDPTLTIENALDNDTTFAWSGYNVVITLPTNFVLSAQSVIAPAGWTATITQQGNVWNGIEYVGIIDLYGGPLVNIGDTLDFTYKMTFSGLTSFTFCQTLTPVPEPSTVGLVLIGGLLLARSTFRRGRRQG